MEWNDDGMDQTIAVLRFSQNLNFRYVACGCAMACILANLDTSVGSKPSLVQGFAWLNTQWGSRWYLSSVGGIEFLGGGRVPLFSHLHEDLKS